MINCSLRNKDRRLTSRKNLAALKPPLVPSSLHEYQSVTLFDNCGVIELPAVHKCNGMKTFLESFVEDLVAKYSAVIWKLILVSLNFN